jgi:CRP-like cAMP-binding protein
MQARRCARKINTMVGIVGVMEKEDTAVLSGAALFTGIPSEDLSELLEQSRVRSLQNREVLFRPDHPAFCLYLVIRGKLQVYRGERAGKHAVLAVFLPGSAVALEAALEQGAYGTTAEAVGNCRLIEFPASAFRHAVDRGGRLGANVVRVLAHNLDQAFQQLERIQLKPTSQRLADFLLSLISENKGEVDLVLPYEKALIANYLGMEPESLSRALKDLQSLGVDNRGRRVHIADISKLRDFSRMPSAGQRAI